jgi:hypothetical protein
MVFTPSTHFCLIHYRSSLNTELGLFVYFKRLRIMLLYFSRVSKTKWMVLVLKPSL